jgi:hypothetical protein
VRKILIVFWLWLAALSVPAFADTFYLTDGGSVVGDIIKADDVSVMFRQTDETYTNVVWAKLSQDTLKHLAADPKTKAFAEPFIEPDATQLSPKPEIKVNAVKRLERPENPSVFAGFFKSSVGLFILFMLYAANLFAAYEISIVKLRPPVQVMGAAAVLPVIAPVLFLWLPVKSEISTEQKEAEAMATEVVAAQQEQIQIAEASWKTDPAASAAPKKLEPQVYPRGKYTFNKRFLETRFADFVNGGELSKKYSMELRTMKARMLVERIAQVSQNDCILETPQGQVSVPLTEIQEIKLNPRNA